MHNKSDSLALALAEIRCIFAQQPNCVASLSSLYQKRGEHTLGMKPNYLSAEYFFSMKQKTLFLDGGYPPYNQKAAKIFRRLFSGPRVGRFLDFGLWEQSSRHQQSTFGIMEKYNYDFNDHCIQYKIINCKIFSYSLNFFFKSIKIYMNMN